MTMVGPMQPRNEIDQRHCPLRRPTYFLAHNDVGIAP
jgi:hypothetical protein